MPYIAIALISAVGILFLQESGAIPVASVGGPMVIGFVSLIAVLAVAICEAWESQRGILGWIINVFVVIAGVLMIAPFCGMLVVLLVSPFMTGSSSLATEGGALMSLSLAMMMGIAVFSAWASLRLLNRVRKTPVAAGEPGA